MKRSLVIASLIIASALVNSCKKEELTHVTDFDIKIITAVNNYREANGKSRIVHQYLLANDAKSYSSKMASGQVAYSTDGVLSTLTTLQNNLDGDASGAIVQVSDHYVADTVVNRMIRDPQKRSILLSDYNQTSVGSAKDASGTWYVTQLFIHIPNK